MTPSAAAAKTMRELRVAGEIAQAFLTAHQPHEVYRLALERVAPLVGASLGCVFVADGESDLLKVATAYNWPQRYANYLSSMRVLIGNGPTGRAVQDNQLVDVADVFADPELKDWWDSAKELGFTSSIALPLIVESRPVGALTFYFRDAEAFREADRNLLRLVANQLAATAEKAHLIEDLQRVNEKLREQNLDLEAKYKEADEAKQVKNEFLANVSHELRTPLTAILGYAYLLKEGVSGPLAEEQAASVRKIEEAGGHLVSLIDGLVDLTNRKLGRVQSKPELCDATAIARTVMSNAPRPAAGVDLRTEAPPERLPMHTDPVLVQRVLQSLLGNAIKFTRSGSVTLTVRLEEPEPSSDAMYARGPNIVWEITDTGVGIEPKDQEVIFDEFRQADGSATRRFGGVGLGLAVARGLARRLGGDITLKSELGVGSTFSFVLPSSVVRAGVPS